MMLGNFIEMVKLTREFSVAMKQPVDAGLLMSTELLSLRLKLIAEETKEFTHAIMFESNANTLKEGCDLLYVLAGGIATVGTDCLDFSFNYECVNPNLPYTHIEDLRPYCKLIETQGNLAAQVVKLHNDKNTRKWYFNYHIPYFMYLVFDLLSNFLFAGNTDLMMDAFKEVHASNMTKLGDDGKPVYREDGKVIKGPNYRKPNMEQFIFQFYKKEINIEDLKQVVENAAKEIQKEATQNE